MGGRNQESPSPTAVWPLSPRTALAEGSGSPAAPVQLNVKDAFQPSGRPSQPHPSFPERALSVRSLSTGAESLCSPGLHLPLRSALKVLCKLAPPRPGRDCSSCLKARSRLLPPSLFPFPLRTRGPTRQHLPLVSTCMQQPGPVLQSTPWPPPFSGAVLGPGGYLGVSGPASLELPAVLTPRWAQACLWARANRSRAAGGVLSPVFLEPRAPGSSGSSGP